MQTKKLIFILLLLLVTCTACQKKEINPQAYIQRFDRAIGALGRSQITQDRDLIGERVLGKDAYVGTYLAVCQNAEGRDVVFGGASIQDRTVYLHGKITAEQGKVQLRLRLGSQVSFIEPDENGAFSVELVFSGGGNYIMLDYDNFKGTVKLYADYKIPAYANSL